MIKDPCWQMSKKKYAKIPLPSMTLRATTLWQQSHTQRWRICVYIINSTLIIVKNLIHFPRRWKSCNNGYGVSDDDSSDSDHHSCNNNEMLIIIMINIMIMIMMVMITSITMVINKLVIIKLMIKIIRGMISRLNKDKQSSKNTNNNVNSRITIKKKENTRRHITILHNTFIAEGKCLWQRLGDKQNPRQVWGLKKSNKERELAKQKQYSNGRSCWKLKYLLIYKHVFIDRRYIYPFIYM